MVFLQGYTKKSPKSLKQLLNGNIYHLGFIILFLSAFYEQVADVLDAPLPLNIPECIS